jgi:hypothetical protein
MKDPRPKAPTPPPLDDWKAKRLETPSIRRSSFVGPKHVSSGQSITVHDFINLKNGECSKYGFTHRLARSCWGRRRRGAEAAVHGIPSADGSGRVVAVPRRSRSAPRGPFFSMRRASMFSSSSRREARVCRAPTGLRTPLKYKILFNLFPSAWRHCQKNDESS